MSSRGFLFRKFFGGLIFPAFVWTYENVALHKPAWQKDPYLNNAFSASLAVDGRKTDLSEYGGQCVPSSYGSTAEWRVDLKGILSIHHIAIQYGQTKPVWDEDDTKTKSFLGFSLYVSNTTTKEDGVLCFKDKNYTRATIPNPINITCPYHGRYVIYYNNRTHPPYPDWYSKYAYTYLCEVEVFGCSSPGFYGENCSIPCPRNCQEGHCHIVEGNCLDCLPGYRGVTCNNVCDGGMFGKHCNESCGKCLNDGQCHHINGSCLFGCNPGYHGMSCKEECPNGKYGQNCEENCSMHCTIPGNCDRVTGHCVGGCQTGWKNAQCDQECDGGMFGKYCNESCGECLNDGQCHHINGSCLNGCDSGYHGINCTEECDVGLFGANCAELCSLNCKTPGFCDKVTGQCEGGCQAGWTQRKCDAMCGNGAFGQDCTEQCGECLRKEQCHHVNGSCANGCNPGYQGIMCTNGCHL
uniref:Multiple epidermal growth factor-like domains protein 10 n=1 Tax=Crassostrea virginica TaxID=6565 RepID=A0A8B8BYY0_CRAVI|nr:multiple epidermal growth factor-like domains protein 10 [Crassostrea virginica]